MTTTHAPIFEASRHSLRGHRVAGTVDYRIGPAVDAYLGHIARCVADREVTLSEGLVLANAAVKLATRCVPLPEARMEPRADSAPAPPVPAQAFPSRADTLVRDVDGGGGSWRRPREPVARPRCPTCTGT